MKRIILVLCLFSGIPAAASEYLSSAANQGPPPTPRKPKFKRPRPGNENERVCDPVTIVENHGCALAPQALQKYRRLIGAGSFSKVYECDDFEDLPTLLAVIEKDVTGVWGRKLSADVASNLVHLFARPLPGLVPLLGLRVVRTDAAVQGMQFWMERYNWTLGELRELLQHESEVVRAVGYAALQRALRRENMVQIFAFMDALGRDGLIYSDPSPSNLTVRSEDDDLVFIDPTSIVSRSCFDTITVCANIVIDGFVDEGSFDPDILSRLQLIATLMIISDDALWNEFMLPNHDPVFQVPDLVEALEFQRKLASQGHDTVLPADSLEYVHKVLVTLKL